MEAVKWRAMALATLGVASVASSAEGPAAVLTVTSGHVEVLRNGRTLADGPPVALLPGDQVVVAPGGTAMLILPNSAPKKIVAANRQTVFRVAGDTGQRPKGGGPLSRLWRYLLGSVSRRSPEYTQAASRAGDTCPEGMWPCDSQVRHPRPEFAWQPVSGASYQLVLLDGKGDQVWRSPVMEQTQMTYPDDARELAQGMKYWWEVLAIRDDQISAAGPYWVQTLSPDRAGAIGKLLARVDDETQDQEADVRLMARALTLASDGMRGEALALLANLAPQQPPTRDRIDPLRALVGPPADR